MKLLNYKVSMNDIIWLFLLIENNCLNERGKKLNNDKQREDKVKYLIETGAEIAGGAVGAALGLLTTNPVLAVTFGAVGAGISKGLIDATGKYLSHREEVRTGAAAAQAIANINGKLKSGQEMRQDDFFESTLNSRSGSEELFEGVLLSSKNEHEEKKVKYIANIFSNSVFLPISLGEGNHVLRLANNLTYRQMCVLALINRNKTLLNIELGKKLLRENKDLISQISVEAISLRQEIMDMDSQGVIACEVVEENEEVWSSARITQNDNDIAMLHWADVVPAGLKLTELGELCYNLMELAEIPDSEIFEVAKLLQI